jgi:hypothetical protein
MTEAEDIAGRINNLASQMRGRLRFWGQWFGRPYDNCHHLVECEAEGDVLRLTFDAGETLCVWSPRRTGLDAAARHESGIGAFRITDAERIRWEWFYYARPQSGESRCFMGFRKTRLASTPRPITAEI